MTSIRNPDAAVLLFNYSNRGGSEGLDPSNVDRLDNTYTIQDPILSIETGKEKAHPVGQFQIRLAPTRNWTSFISPGSWLTIHMAPRKITQEEILGSSEETLKMIGRVDTVRVNVSVDQTTGARQTTYVIAGRDWGQIFESYLYIDPVAGFGEDQPMGSITRFGFDESILRLMDGKNAFTTTTLTKFFIELWGKASIDNIFEGSPLNVNRYSAKAQFKVPNKLSNLLSNKGDIETNNLADLVNIVAGTLNGLDKYTDLDEAVTTIDGHSLIGTNSIWQLISAHSCDVVNELVSELRWDKTVDLQGKPAITLYKRIKPFAITRTNDTTDPSLLLIGSGIQLIDKTQSDSSGSQLLLGGIVGKHTDRVTSSFFDLKKTYIPAEDVIQIDAGTNWRDSINFIELLPNISWMSVDSTAGAVAKVQNKNDSSIFDPNGSMIARDGLRPMMLNTTAVPPDDDFAPQPEALQQWLPVLKNWYFDTHKMFNGSIAFMGQPKYIPVGSNIVVDSKLLGATDLSTISVDTSLLAHVESVSNSFSYSEDGGRSFTSIVSFVRGIVTDQAGSRSIGGIEAIADDAQNNTPKSLNLDNTFVIKV